MLTVESLFTGVHDELNLLNRLSFFLVFDPRLNTDFADRLR